MTPRTPVQRSAAVAVNSAVREMWHQRKNPDPHELAPGVWAFAAPIPGHGPLPWTYCYALQSGNDIHLIDPGWSHMIPTGCCRVTASRSTDYAIDASKR